jgi:hypothetical protein
MNSQIPSSYSLCCTVKVKYNLHMPCRAHAVPVLFPCHAMPRPCHSPTVPCPYCGTRWHCAISRKVAGSIPDIVTGICHWHNHSSHSVVLGLTHPLTEISTGNNCWGKGGWCVGLIILPPSCAAWLEVWEPQNGNAQGLSRRVMGLPLL